MPPVPRGRRPRVLADTLPSSFAAIDFRSSSMSISGSMAPVESTNVSVYLGMCSVSSMPFRYAAIRRVYLLVYLRLPEIAGYSRKTASGFILETSRFRWKIAKNGGFPTKCVGGRGYFPICSDRWRISSSILQRTTRSRMATSAPRCRYPSPSGQGGNQSGHRR